MSKISKLITEIKSEGILRAGNKLEQLYSIATQMETDYAALQQKLDALAALKSSRCVSASELIPQAWYFQLTFEITNLDNMTPYQAHGAAWEQSRSHILRKLEEMKCTESPLILLPEIQDEITSVPEDLENTLTYDEKSAWISGANSFRESIFQLVAHLGSGTHDTADKAGAK